MASSATLEMGVDSERGLLTGLSQVDPELAAAGGFAAEESDAAAPAAERADRAPLFRRLSLACGAFALASAVVAVANPGGAGARGMQQWVEGVDFEVMDEKHALRIKRTVKGSGVPVYIEASTDAEGKVMPASLEDLEKAVPWVIKFDTKEKAKNIPQYLQQLEIMYPEDIQVKYSGPLAPTQMPFVTVKSSLKWLEESLETDFGVHYVEQDVQIAAIPELPGNMTKAKAKGERKVEDEAPWGLDRIDARSGLDGEYHFETVAGAGVHAYILDTGIRVTHEEFEGRAIPTLEVVGHGAKVCLATDTTCAADKMGHGTHCAGTIGGKTYGVAKKATLHAVKILADNGAGSFSWFLEAVNWVIANGARPAVISASLGGPGNLQAAADAVQAAVDAGITVVVAAGNEGATSHPDACDFTPAYAPAAITVGATQSDDKRAYYSNIGSCIDIFAPGTDILSASFKSDTGSATMSGTSMACPHVSGAVAVLLSEHPTFTPKEVTEELIKTSTPDKVTDDKGTVNKLLYSLDTVYDASKEK